MSSQRNNFYFLVLLLSVLTCKTMSQNPLAAANAQFSNKLFQELIKDSPDTNIFFSPLSVHTILSLIYQGADGPTKTALANVLNLPEQKATADGYQQVMSELNNVQNVTLNIANKVWLKDGLQLAENFQTLATKNFFAEAESVKFEPASATKKINNWVEEKTNHKIKDLISEDMIDPVNTAMILVNALYFKGNWAKKFEPRATVKQPFYVSTKEQIDVDMMHISGDFRFGVDESMDAKILELPYSNHDVSMLIILPNQRDGIKRLQESIITKDLSTISKNLRKMKVDVSLPKFKVETKIDLKNLLNKMGLDIIFSEAADFHGLLKDNVPLKVSDAVQKAFIEVNEEGSEAAAATGIGVMAMSLPMTPTPAFIVDHPFYFVIKHKTNSLFVGKISKP